MNKVVLIIFLILQGCATSLPTHFYNLDAMATPVIAESTGHKKFLIGVAQVSLPSMLERKQLVTRDKNGQLFFSEQYQWAALLKQNMTEVLAKNLAMQQPNLWFKAYPWSLLGKVDYRLVIDVTKLDVVLGKAITFSADWTLLNETTHAVLKHNSFDLNKPLENDDYETAVKNLNQLLVDVTTHLTAVLQPELFQ